MRIFLATIVTTLLLSATSQSAMAISLFDRDIPALYADSLTVAEIRVTEIQGKCESNKACPGYRLVAVVERLWKDSMDSPSTISICSVIPLDLSITYTLFLFDPKEKAADIYSCTHLLSEDGVFEKRGSYTYRIRSHESAVIAPRFGQIYYTDAIRVSDFEEQLAAVVGAKD